MPKRLQTLAAEMAKLNSQIKHSMEQAEAKVSHVNDLIAELAGTGVLTHTVLLGKYREHPVDPDAAPPAPGRIIQAALLVPEGLGICQWDSEQAYQLDQAPRHYLRDAREKFLPFDELEEADQMFILPQVETLLEELMAIAQGMPTART